MVKNYVYAITCLCSLFINAYGNPWFSSVQEKLDEIHDTKIIKAILTSMNDYYKRHNNARSKREVLKSCYDDLGCFEAAGPFAYLDMLPDPPQEIATKFLLFPTQEKRRSGQTPLTIPYENRSEADAWVKKGFNTSLPLKVIVHGFGSDCTHIWVYEMRSALMAVEDVNILCVDWSNGAALPNYVKAVANTRLVGTQLGNLLKQLENLGFRSSNTHMIGFSLGAHVAGFAGSKVGTVSRITGLDPAGPLFESQDPIARLDESDAKFVDVIHSNGDTLFAGGFGFRQPLGHADFYPNGGRVQKGCSNVFFGAVADILSAQSFESRSLCNHRRAYKFFTDSVSPKCRFPAFSCSSYDDFLEGKCFPCTDERKCGNMGYYADRSKGRGQFYLMTREEEPFCAHQYQIKIESFPDYDGPFTITYGNVKVTLVGDSILNETFVLTKKDDDELMAGTTLTRIIVPHPVLLEPSQIEVLFTGYSGWFTSESKTWKIDRITWSDSFGRRSSVCKKNLILKSGIPVVLPLFPGECNVPSPTDVEPAEDRIDEKRKNSTFSDINVSKFVPTPVIKIGSEVIKNKDPFDLFNITWNDNNNIVETEGEQSRAFNTRSAPPKPNAAETKNREVVEPILKPQGHKNGRSHDPNKDKPEITEPILGPTTSKATTEKQNIISKLINNNPEVAYNFYDLGKDDDWVPSVSTPKPEHKWKRQDESKAITNESSNNSFTKMVMQLFPESISKLIIRTEQLTTSLISSWEVPKIFTNFMYPAGSSRTPKYIPLKYEENTEKVVQTTPNRREHKNVEKNKSFNPPPKNVEELVKTDAEDVSSTTPYTHIQKIEKKTEKVTTTERSKGRSVDAPDEVPKSNGTKTEKEIYIDLPVFDESQKERKYIPLLRDESKPENKTKS